ncbi:MAG: GNAT family N-acetyltransferase [Rhodospirillaceae bacterium]
MSSSDFHVRWITPETAQADAPDLLALMRGLARFEGWETNLLVTEPELARRLALPTPPFRAVVAEAAGGMLIGFATMFDITYSYAARPSLELEMLYVEKAWRSRGAGAAIMNAVFDRGRAGGYERLEWNVLRTNKKAKRFYARLDGEEQIQWTRWKKWF